MEVSTITRIHMEFAFLVKGSTKKEVFVHSVIFAALCTFRDFIINLEKHYSHGYVHVTVLMT